MGNVRFLKLLPWLVLFLLWATGTTLWLLFVNEQAGQLRAGYRIQLERLGDELLRNRLEGQLGPEGLPEGIRTFAVYGPQGELVASWGSGAPQTLGVPPGSLARGGQILGNRGGWVDFVKVLEPLRPRLELWGEGDEGDDRRMRGPGRGARQGFWLLRVSDGSLQGRVVGWWTAGGLGALAWTGFMAFVGVLWFRARSYQTALVQHRELLQFAEASRTLSHELQNPLAAILLQTALWKRSNPGEAPAEVTIIEEEARRMSALVARVRDFLKDPSGQPERIDLFDLATSLRERFASPVGLVAEGKGPFIVLFDPHRLRSVVENLLKNALESGPDAQPELRLLRPKAGTVRLEVLDAGPGFTPEALRQARNPFFTTKTTGTGIGLSIADSFVTAAGGRLRLENRPEGGARVTVDLPEAPQEAAL